MRTIILGLLAQSSLSTQSITIPYLYDTHKLAHNVFIVIPHETTLVCYRLGPHKNRSPQSLPIPFNIFQDPTRSRQDSLRRPKPILSPRIPQVIPKFPPRSPRYPQLFALQSENVFIWFCVQLYQHDTHKLAHHVFLVIPMGPISLGCYRFGPHKKQIPPILSNSLYILQDPTRSLEDFLRRPNPKSLTQNHLSHSKFSQITIIFLSVSLA